MTSLREPMGAAPHATTQTQRVVHWRIPCETGIRLRTYRSRTQATTQRALLCRATPLSVTHPVCTRSAELALRGATSYTRRAQNCSRLQHHLPTRHTKKPRLASALISQLQNSLWTVEISLHFSSPKLQSQKSVLSAWSSSQKCCSEKPVSTQPFLVFCHPTHIPQGEACAPVATELMVSSQEAHTHTHTHTTFVDQPTAADAYHTHTHTHSYTHTYSHTHTYQQTHTNTQVASQQRFPEKIVFQTNLFKPSNTKVKSTTSQTRTASGQVLAVTPTQFFTLRNHSVSHRHKPGNNMETQELHSQFIVFSSLRHTMLTSQ